MFVCSKVLAYLIEIGIAWQRLTNVMLVDTSVHILEARLLLELLLLLLLLV